VKQLSDINQYVLGLCLQTIITMNNNLTDMVFQWQFLPWPRS